ncbi:Gamma-interferon-responsive lysosomal thiol protein-like protein [Drosera capensis]
MAATRCSTTVIVFILSYIIAFCVISATATMLRSSSDSDSKVLYYESLCPYSADFIVDYLAKVFEEEDLVGIIDLKLFPWGNAKFRANSTIFDCQHGPSECLLNTIEACAIAVWHDVEKHFSFIYCIETLVHEHRYPQWETCFQLLQLDPKPIRDCYSSGYGKELELKYAAETSALEPPHEYVPWVVVDGQPLYEDYENFLSYVCKAYKGSTVPKACSEVSHIRTARDNPENFHPVCYSEKPAKATLWTKIQSALSSWGLSKMVNVAVA